MRAIMEFTSEPMPPDGVGGVPRLRLIQHGRVVSEPIAGAVLEAQFACQGGYLVFTSDDSPYEEILHIHLFDETFHCVDALDLGKPFQPGLLRNLHTEGAATVQFSFFGEDLWKLKVLDRPARRFALGGPVRYPGSGWGGRHRLWLTSAA